MNWLKVRFHEGFTLIEVIVVMGIIGILSTAGIFSYTGSLDNANKSKALQDIHDIVRAVETLSIHTGKYSNGCPIDEMSDPENTDLNQPSAGLTQKPVVATIDADCFWTAQDIALWGGPYTKTISLDPWGRAYQFDPDYWGRSGIVGLGAGCTDQDASGNYLFSDGVAVVSSGKDGVEYTCDDVTVYLYKSN